MDEVEVFDASTGEHFFRAYTEEELQFYATLETEPDPE